MWVQDGGGLGQVRGVCAVNELRAKEFEAFHGVACGAPVAGVEGGEDLGAGAVPWVGHLAIERVEPKVEIVGEAALEGGVF